MTKRLTETTAQVDRAIGATIRGFRQLAGMSQERLADGIGVTFQQVQKYEKGMNRVAASTLLRICTVLHVSPMDILGPLFGGPADAMDAMTGLKQRLVDAEAKLAKIRRLLGDDDPFADIVPYGTSEGITASTIQHQ
ncbi:helix-turn-helix transcriptional regulator [Rhizobium sp. BK602]|uniref:helix-turn-helix domain-containing protein n=1 Tax=Rhizobium sp. BK602 TaxID=2586986 RepID=UPI00161DE1A7|nr:helix-turn-helix transcriptional regulator [Rhizobium sp. BK602]MBB3608635.1 transcriptional regulator with XRE-family HTH domain [Rhizobium sp. BK602]